MAILIGQTVTHYKLLGHLGGGGMGVVYKAQDLRLDRPVALKFLPSDLTRDPDARQRFIHEAKAASALQHDNICTVHDIDQTEDGQLFIVMDCYEGETLKKRLERGPLPIDEAVDIALQVARGLAKAHEHGISHRDIKPANLMVTKEGEVKIVDFGLAKLACQTRLTRAGSTLGTVAYMSPEQARGEEVDHRSDIWSLGVVLYEMITGRPPFASDYEQALVYAILNDEVRPIPGVSPHLEEVVHKALEKEPSARYQRVAEFAEALKDLREKAGVERGRREGRRHAVTRAWVGISGIIVLGGIAAVTMYVIHRPSEQDIPPPVKRLVVLPFENLGPAENEYFADGMTEELTSRLSSVGDLRVISRTSAVQYARTDKPMEQIGRELKVDYALEGAVRWAPVSVGASRVRITSNLARIADKTTLWAETYDRVIDDIFAVQSEISQKVIERLGVTILQKEQETVGEPPTDNVEAYHAFLRAEYYRKRPHFTVENWLRAVEAYQQSVELDTAFALAFAELARAHARLYYLWHDHSAARLAMASRAAERAMALGPGMPRVHLALGYYYLYTGRDSRKAAEQCALAETYMPPNVEIYEARAAMAARDGRWEEAMEFTREALDLSPRDASLSVDLSEYYFVLRKYEEAVRTCNLAIELAPDDAWPYLMKAFSLWSWKGVTPESRTAIEAVPATHDWAPWAGYWQSMFERDYRRAIRRLSSHPETWIRTKCWAMPKSLLTGYAYRLLGEVRESRDAYENARSLLEREVTAWPDDPRYHSSLGIAYAALGRKEEAIQEGKKGVELLPITTDAFYGIPYVEDLAFIYALTGETDAALDRLDYLLSIPSWISVPFIRMDPQWDSIRDRPEFHRLLEKHSRSDGNTSR